MAFHRQFREALTMETERSHLSRTFTAATVSRVVRFGFARHEAVAGTWVHIPTGLRHGIQAKTPVVMLLMLLN